MNDSNVIQLSARRPSAELEEAWLGAVLSLPEKLALLDSAGLAKEDFENGRIAIACTIARRLSERRREVSALTVASAGKNVGMLSDSDAGWLVGLEAGNAMSREQALQLAEDIRGRSRMRNVRLQLQQVIDGIDGGNFHPGRLTGNLESIVHGLATDFAPNETADADLLSLNASWEENARAGKLNVDPTGIPLLDGIIGGHPKNIFFLQGRPGVGKNAYFATVIKAQLKLDQHLAATGRSRTGLIGLESGTKWLTKRWQSEDLDIPLREIGSRKLTEEQVLRKAQLDQEHYELLQRVEIFSAHGLNRGELLRRLMRWVFTSGVTRVFIDNSREVKHRDPRLRQETWEAAAETVRVVRDFAERYEIPVCFAIHDTEDDPRPGHEGPPNPKKMQGGQDAGARARMVLGLWSKGSSIRCTVTKSEMSDAGMAGPTIEFKRNYEAGTFDPAGGRLIDLKNEAAAERRDRREQAVDESLERDALRKKKRAAQAPEKPATPAEPAPQQALPLEEPKFMTPIAVLRAAREQLKKGWSGPHAEARPLFVGNCTREDGEPCSWRDEGVYRLDLTGALHLCSRGDADSFWQALRAFGRIVSPVWVLEEDFVAELGPGGLPPFSEETRPLYLRARQIFALDKGPSPDEWLQHQHRTSVEVLQALGSAILRLQMGERT